MANTTIVNGVYKPTNITGGHHPALNPHVFPMVSATSDTFPKGGSSVLALRHAAVALELLRTRQPPEKMHGR